MIRRLDPPLTSEDAVTLQKLLFVAIVLPCERKRYFALWHAHQGLSSYQIEAMEIMTSPRVRRIIALYKKGGLVVAYLPPYSPELNLMEGAWRQLKYQTLSQRHFATKEDLQLSVGGANWGVAI